MDVGLQRKIDQTIGQLVCRVLSLFSGGRALSGPPKRILVILLSEMGSCVLGYSMFRRLAERFPQAEVHTLVFKENREVLELLDAVPTEHVMALNSRSLGHLVSDSLSAIRNMRRLRFDVVIDCELFSRVSSIFARISGAPIRVGFHRHTMEGLYRGDFITRPVFYNPYRHISDQFLTLVDAIDSQSVPKNKLEAYTNVLKAPPAMRLREGEQAAMEKRLHDDFPAIIGKRLVLLYPSGGILPIRAWPLESYCRIAKDVVERGYAVAVIGLPGDKDLARAILAYCRSPLCIDLTGYTKTLRELLVIFHLAALLIANDGGPGQFAAMTPIRSILFFGPETPALYGPNSPNAKVFFSGLACSPCLTAYNHRNSPCDGDNRCLKIITPESVLESALMMIEEGSRFGSDPPQSAIQFT